VIADQHGRFREVPGYYEQVTNAVDIPTIGRNDSGDLSEHSNTGDLKEEVIRELEIAETTDGVCKDVLRDIIGQALKEMGKYDCSESGDNADTEELRDGYIL
jgi:hypothetical protein